MTPADIVSLSLAGVAIIISTITLVWNIRQASWELPRLEVTGYAKPGLLPDPPYYPFWALSLKIVNTGKLAVDIEEGSWVVEIQPGNEIRFVAGEGEFPMRLESHASREWTLVHQTFGTNLADFRGRPEVSAVQRVTERERRRGRVSTGWIAGPMVSLRAPSDEWRDSYIAALKDADRGSV